MKRTLHTHASLRPAVALALAGLICFTAPAQRQGRSVGVMEAVTPFHLPGDLAHFTGLSVHFERSPHRGYPLGEVTLTDLGDDLPDTLDSVCEQLVDYRWEIFSHGGVSVIALFPIAAQAEIWERPVDMRAVEGLTLREICAAVFQEGNVSVHFEILPGMGRAGFTEITTLSGDSLAGVVSREEEADELSPAEERSIEDLRVEIVDEYRIRIAETGEAEPPEHFAIPLHFEAEGTLTFREVHCRALLQFQAESGRVISTTHPGGDGVQILVR